MLAGWRAEFPYGVGCCVSLLGMAQSERFQLSVRVLAVLGGEPDAMHTSAAIAEALKESAVMGRRKFLLLHKGGVIVPKEGAHGVGEVEGCPEEVRLGGGFAGYGGG